MKKRNLFILVMMIFLISFPLFSEGVQEPVSGTALPARGTDSFLRSTRASAFLNYDVDDGEGNVIGTVEDLVFDLNIGTLSYFVVRFYELENLDSGNLYPIPLFLFDENQNQNRLTLLIEDYQNLENVQPMSEVVQEGVTADRESRWQFTMTSYWQNTGVYNVPLVRQRVDEIVTDAYTYGVGSRIAPLTLMTFSRLTEKPVRDGTGRELGNINDLWVDFGTGASFFALLSVSPELGAEYRRYAIPIGAFELNTRNFYISYNIRRYGFGSVSALKDTETDIRSESRYQELVEYWNGSRTGIMLQAGMQTLPTSVISFSEINGYSVLNMEGSGVGDLVDFTVSRNGDVDYGVVDIGGFFDMSSRLSFIPLAVMDVYPNSLTVGLPVLLTELRNAPSFQEGSMPDTSGPNWDRPIRRYWNQLYQNKAVENIDVEQNLSTEKLDDPEALLANDYVGSGVRNKEDVVLGEIDDLYVDIANEQVAYVALSVGGFLDIGDVIYPVPIERLSYLSDREGFLLDVSETRLENAPTMDEGVWPAQDPDWEYQVKRFWSDVALTD